MAQKAATANTTISPFGGVSGRAKWCLVVVTATAYPTGNVNLTQDGIALHANLTGISADVRQEVILHGGDVAITSSNWASANGVVVDIIPLK